MTYQEPLSKISVAVSISDSPDMDVLGLGREHLDDAMAEVARHLLAMGARLMYGGDLRPRGFTELLFELVARHRRDADLGDERVGVTNFLAWPVHVGLTAEAVEQLSADLSGAAELVCLTAGGRVMTVGERQALATRLPAADEWREGLTAMRRRMTAMSHARIALGGRVDQFKGRMPGVAEETLTALQAGQPVFVLGGFGGCARDIVECLGLAPPTGAPRPPWPGQDVFARFTKSSLNNGLTSDENQILARTPHIDQAVTLVLRGLLNRANAGFTRRPARSHRSGSRRRPQLKAK